MTAFNIQFANDLPDTAFIKLDERFDVAISRTPDGLEIRVYPLTDGEIWFEPFTTFTVNEADVIELEKQMGE